MKGNPEVIAILNEERVLIRRATHLSNLDQPERFTAAVRRFAERIGSPDG